MKKNKSFFLPVIYVLVSVLVIAIFMKVGEKNLLGSSTMREGIHGAWFAGGVICIGMFASVITFLKGNMLGAYCIQVIALALSPFVFILTDYIIPSRLWYSSLMIGLFAFIPVAVIGLGAVTFATALCVFYFDK